MKRKTEDHGTTLTTWEMLTPTLKFKFTTYKEPGQIITTASCRRVADNGTEFYSYGSEYMVEVDRTWHKRVTAPMVQAHHRTEVANLYDKFKAIAITWNVARNKMPKPLTEEELEAQNEKVQALIHELETVGISSAPAATATYRGTLSTTSGMRIIESNHATDALRWSAGTALQAINRATRLDPVVREVHDETTGTVRDLLNYYVSQRT